MSLGCYLGSIFGGGHYNCPNPYLDSTIVLFDIKIMFQNQESYTFMNPRVIGIFTCITRLINNWKFFKKGIGIIEKTHKTSREHWSGNESHKSLFWLLVCTTLASWRSSIRSGFKIEIWGFQYIPSRYSCFVSFSAIPIPLYFQFFYLQYRSSLTTSMCSETAHAIEHSNMCTKPNLHK